MARHFFAVAKTEWEQQLLVRIKSAKGSNIQCCIVAPCLNSHGQRFLSSFAYNPHQLRVDLSNTSHPYIIRNLTDASHNPYPCDDDDGDEGDEDDAEGSEKEKASELYKYEVYVCFNIKVCVYDKRWVCRWFNPSLEDNSFITACSYIQSPFASEFDSILARLITNKLAAHHGVPKLSQSGMFAVLDGMYHERGPVQDERSVLGWITKLYKDGDKPQPVQQLYKEWSKGREPVETIQRMQKYKATDPAFQGPYPFR